jgi:hypothetical protein
MNEGANLATQLFVRFNEGRIGDRRVPFFAVSGFIKKPHKFSNQSITKVPRAIDHTPENPTLVPKLTASTRTINRRHPVRFRLKAETYAARQRKGLYNWAYLCLL